MFVLDRVDNLIVIHIPCKIVLDEIIENLVEE